MQGNNSIEEVVHQCLDVIGGVVVTETPPLRPPQEPIFCAMCPDELEPAAFYCLVCPGLPLCLKCKDKHIVRMKGHEAVPVEESKYAMCTKHPDKRVEICCDFPCHELICATCGLLGHAGHQFSSLSAAAERQRAELKRVADKAMEAITVSAAEAVGILDALVAYVAGLHGSVTEEGEKLIQLIQQKIAEAHVAIDTKVAPELQRLGKAKDVSRDLAGRVRSCTAVANRLRDPAGCSDAEVYQLAPVRFFVVCRCDESREHVIDTLSESIVDDESMKESASESK